MLFSASDILKSLLKWGYVKAKEYRKQNKIQLEIDELTYSLFLKYNRNGKYALIDDIEQNEVLQDILKNYVSGFEDTSFLSNPWLSNNLDADKKTYYLEFLKELSTGVKIIYSKHLDNSTKLVMNKLDDILNKLNTDSTVDKNEYIYEYNAIIENLIAKNTAYYQIEYDEKFTIDKRVSKLDSAIFMNVNRLLSELIDNAYIHGKAQNTNIKISSDKIIIFDDGIKFNPIEMKSSGIIGGGEFTLDYIRKNYPSLINFEYEYANGNVLTISFKATAFDIESVSEIVVTNYERDYSKIDIKDPDVQADVYFFNPSFFLNLSSMCRILGMVSNQIGIQNPIIVSLKDDLMQRYFSYRSVGPNIYFRNINIKD